MRKEEIESVNLLFNNGDVAEIPALSIDFFLIEDFKQSYIWKLNDITGKKQSEVLLTVGNIEMTLDCKGLQDLKTEHGKGVKNRILKVSDVTSLQLLFDYRPWWVSGKDNVREYQLGWTPSIGMSICNPAQITNYTGSKIEIKWNFLKDSPAVQTKGRFDWCWNNSPYL